MVFIYLVVTLCLSMTSLVTCSQDTCPVVDYRGRIDVNNHVKDHAILGYSYKNLTTDTIRKCFSACVQDCRCLSYQLSGNRCELVDENRHTAPDSFKAVSGYVYLELKQEFRNERSGSCSSRCFNGCCRSSPCQNGGTCIELCDNVTRKFECKCKPGYVGRVCDLPISCAAHGSQSLPGLFPIFTTNSNSINVYCDMTSEPGMVWTLIESFALSQNHKYQRKDFAENFPVNENSFNWTDYRLSHSVMQHIKYHSTHWRATCNYDKDGLVKTDYMKGRLRNVDAIAFVGNDCFLVEYVNVRGKDCSNCTTHLRQDPSVHMYVGTYAGDIYRCMIGFSDGSNKGSQNFGFYGGVNEAHRCCSSSSSTTQWWLGSTA